MFVWEGRHRTKAQIACKAWGHGMASRATWWLLYMESNRKESWSIIKRHEQCDWRHPIGQRCVNSWKEGALATIKTSTFFLLEPNIPSHSTVHHHQLNQFPKSSFSQNPNDFLGLCLHGNSSWYRICSYCVPFISNKFNSDFKN